MNYVGRPVGLRWVGYMDFYGGPDSRMISSGEINVSQPSRFVYYNETQWIDHLAALRWQMDQVIFDFMKNDRRLP